jgi:hypothetical protein
MAIQSTDLVAVNRSSTNYKETYGNKANIDRSDYLMVEATTTTGGRVIGNQYRCSRVLWDGGGTGPTGPDSSTPVASDLLLIERPSATLNMSAPIGATTLYVNAIPAALPSATVLVFDGVTGYAEFTLTSSASAGATTLTGSGGLKGSNVNAYTEGGVLYKATKTVWDNFPTLADIHSANYMVTLGTLLYGKPSNNTNPYSVVEVQAEFSSSATVGDGTLYIGFRNTAGEGATWGYPYYGDLPIAGVQILQPNGTIVRNPQPGVEYGYCWNFAISADRTEWETTTANIVYPPSGTSGSTGSPKDGDGGIPNPVYSSLVTGATANKFTFTSSGTGSSNVGAAKGIPSAVYTGNDEGLCSLGASYTTESTCVAAGGTWTPPTSILPVGNANVAQSSVSADGYIFVECSGTDTGDIIWLACTSLSGGSAGIHNGDRIRICYFGGGNGPDAGKGLQTADSLYVRYIED